jgi:hypothetical protein
MKKSTESARKKAPKSSSSNNTSKMRGTNEYAEQSEQNELPHGEYSYRRTFTTALINFIAYAAASARNVRRGLLSPEVLMQPGCTSRAWLTLCALRSARGLT